MPIRAFLIILCFALPATSFTKPSLKFALAEGFAVTFSKGEVILPPPTSFMGFGISIPLPKDMNWYIEGAFGTPNTAFNPAPRLITGPSFKFRELITGATLFYQWNPSYAGKESNHQIGATFFLGRSISDKCHLFLLVGFGKVLLDGAWSIALAPKLSCSIL